MFLFIYLINIVLNLFIYQYEYYILYIILFKMNNKFLFIPIFQFYKYY
jgi:hypothetical protein